MNWFEIALWISWAFLIIITLNIGSDIKQIRKKLETVTNDLDKLKKTYETFGEKAKSNEKIKRKSNKLKKPLNSLLSIHSELLNEVRWFKNKELEKYKNTKPDHLVNEARDLIRISIENCSDRDFSLWLASRYSLTRNDDFIKYLVKFRAVSIGAVITEILKSDVSRANKHSIKRD